MLKPVRLESLAVSQVLRIPRISLSELIKSHPERFGSSAYTMNHHRFMREENVGGQFRFHHSPEYPSYFGDSNWRQASACELAYNSFQMGNIYLDLLQRGLISADLLNFVPTHLPTGNAIIIICIDELGKINLKPEYTVEAKNKNRTSLWIQKV